jgi:anti-anti-sigma factor
MDAWHEGQPTNILTVGSGGGMFLPDDSTQTDDDPATGRRASPDRVQHFDLEVQLSSQRTTVFMHGELDVAEADAAWACLDGLLEAGHTTLLVDLTGVTFMDSRGVAVLVRAWNRLRECDGRMTINPSPRVAATLAVAGLEQLLASEP